MTNKKIISDVIISKPKKNETVKEVVRPYDRESAEEQFFSRPPIETVYKTNKLKSMKWPLIIIVVSILLLTLITVRVAINSKMLVNITPNSLTMAVDKNFVLSKAGGTVDTVRFITGVVDYQDFGTFNAEESKVSEKRAEGTVVIYNKSSKDAQILVASTRLQSPDGKIYRIPTMVVIPGFTVVGGKSIPGSKEVRVVADQPGAGYNIGLTDFTIPGFKGSSKFNTIFARSKTEISGGFSGATKIVTKNVLDSATAMIVENAKNKLRSIISKELLKDQLLLPGSEEFTIISTESVPKVGEAADKFELKVSGKVRWATVRKKDIADLVVKTGGTGNNLRSSEVQITNQDALAFKLTGYNYDAPTFNLNIKGNTKIESYIEAEEIKKQIVEKHLTDANHILSQFPGVARAEVKFEPFWTASLPRFLFNPSAHTDRIDITIVSK